MQRLIMKKIIVIFTYFFVAINYVHADEEIKLSCNLKLISEYWTGTSETQYVTDVIEISEIGNKKYIIGNHSDIGSVSSHKSGTGWISATDISDKNRWDISTKRQSGNKTVETSFKIDRNTGKIFYSELTRGPGEKFMRYSGSGDCQKVDTNKKKF